MSGNDHFINRELSWLEFNRRVLEEARDDANPLLERLVFLGITSSNLDEFFEVRVAGLKQQIEAGIVSPGPDGRSPQETLDEAMNLVRDIVDLQYRTWRERIRPCLAREGIVFCSMDDLDAQDLEWVDRFYFEQVSSVLTPLGIDQAHPFPQLLNKSLNIMVELRMSDRGDEGNCLAIVQVPRILSRLVRLPREGRVRHFVLLEEVIFRHLTDLFPGNIILGHWCFRITRNSELYIDEESSANLLRTVEKELYNRRKGAALRLEIGTGCPAHLQVRLTGFLGLGEADVHPIRGPLDFTRLTGVDEEGRYPELRYEPFAARSLEPEEDYFDWIAQQDHLLHHPYDNFSSVIEFIKKAAADPRVLAIKQTLYRSGSDERIFEALTRAARKGKQVTVVVELKARFDEDNNIRSARKLEEEGVHVLYGMVGYKIHCKMCLVLRREGTRIRRYVHLSTGNYNPSTARLYTDIGLLSAREDLGEDVGGIFNLLTGICRYQPTRKLVVAPFDMHRRMIGLVEQEADNSRKGLPARIILKMNALVDPDVIEALYLASQAGVRIDLIIRGICCLRPGVPGLSERITVRSIVGRFLEHSRIFCFGNASRPRIYIGSADWMPRNFFSRIEVLFPLEDGRLRERVMNEILDTYLADNVKSRIMQSDGTYRRLSAGENRPLRNSQESFLEISSDTATKERRERGSGELQMQVRREPPSVFSEQ